MKTVKIALCPIAPEDVAALAEILQNDVIKQTYMVSDMTREEAVALAQKIALLSKNAARFVRGIYLEDTLIGLLNDVGTEDTSIELGWAVHPCYHNRGYATQALHMAIRELFSKRYSSVEAGAFSENAASIRVMEKAGMERQEKTEQITYRGRTHECVYYAIRRNI